MLTPISPIPSTGNGETKWLCKCDCGNLTVVSTSKLRDCETSRTTISCGCAKKNSGPKKGEANLSRLNGRLSRNNKTGISGVHWCDVKHKYIASIGYKGTRITLATCDDFDTCVTIRKMAVDAANDGTFEDFYYALKGKSFICKKVR